MTLLIKTPGAPMTQSCLSSSTGPTASPRSPHPSSCLCPWKRCPRTRYLRTLVLPAQHSAPGPGMAAPPQDLALTSHAPLSSCPGVLHHISLFHPLSTWQHPRFSSSHIVCVSTLVSGKPLPMRAKISCLFCPLLNPPYWEALSTVLS